MSEVSLVAAQRQVITVRMEPNEIQGRDMAGQPVLHLPVKLQLLPGGQNGDGQYTLLRLAGTLLNQPLSDFASFEMTPLAELSNPTPFFRQHDALVYLDRQRIKRFEEARLGADAHIQFRLSVLLWFPQQQTFHVSVSSGFLDVVVPKSHWVEKVIAPWNLSHLKLIEIAFPSSTAGDNYRASYAKIEIAERFFANGQWKQTLGEVYSAFEALATTLGFAKPDQQFFAGLLSGIHPAKKEKIKLTLDTFCGLLQLGRHEPNQRAEDFAISRQDARFALTMAYAIFEYIVPES